jgi:hypothetical protein
MNPSGIALKLTSLFFSAGILIILFKKIKTLRTYGISSVVYIIVVSLLLSFPSLFKMLGAGLTEMDLLIFAQTFVLAVGILHVTLVSTSLPWHRTQPFKMQIIFIFCILFFSYFLNNLSFSFQENQFSPLWHMSLLWFLVPVLLKKTADELMNVPDKTYKLWYYPDHSFGDPSEQDLENPVIISLIFPKNEKSTEMTTFRVKAPLGLKFGQLFYYFINDYNDRHPEGTISYLADNMDPCGWIFRKVASGIFGTRTVIDPDSSVYNNGIKENDLLYCNRILKNI